jgi:hypothetical protein
MLKNCSRCDVDALTRQLDFESWPPIGLGGRDGEVRTGVTSDPADIDVGSSGSFCNRSVRNSLSELSIVVTRLHGKGFVKVVFAYVARPSRECKNEFLLRAP